MRPPTLYSAAAPDADELPSSGEETFAGALTLMTAHAQAPAEERAALARAVSAQLVRIASIACGSPECRLALSVLAAHWAALSDARIDSKEDVLLWHVAPATIQ